jgi:GT2 family glycosyltransferase
MTDRVPGVDRPPLPLVSILVPCFNGERHLSESLDSILAQTYANVDVLLLDDASTDATPAIAAEYAGRVTHIRQPKNLGIFGNVNAGIALARGDLIATYHADDVYLPTIVEAQVAYLAGHPDVGAVFCSDIFIDAEGREYGKLVLPPEIRGERPLDYPTVLNALLCYKNRFLVCPSAMVRASVQREVGPYRLDRYGIAADLEMWLRIARRHPIAVLESHLMKYRHFHGNATQQYFHLRTTPENQFAVFDDSLAGGDVRAATPLALTSYEAHRSEDRLMAAICHYIKDELPEGRLALGQVRLAAIVRSPHVQRWRLLLLSAGLWLLLRLPRVESVARRMYERWHVKRSPAAA